MEENRILAIDYGEKRIGLAITDPLNLFAYPLITLKNDNEFWKNFDKIFTEYKISKIILGFPLKESGSESALAKTITKFKDTVEKKYSISIQLVDERYSSKIAEQRIIESVSSKKKRMDKSLLDKNAAAVMLEDYLSVIKRL